MPERHLHVACETTRRFKRESSRFAGFARWNDVLAVTDWCRFANTLFPLSDPVFTVLLLLFVINQGFLKKEESKQ